MCYALSDAPQSLEKKMGAKNVFKAPGQWILWTAKALALDSYWPTNNALKLCRTLYFHNIISAIFETRTISLLCILIELRPLFDFKNGEDQVTHLVLGMDHCLLVHVIFTNLT